ncbi:hypothetical protein [Roseobacter sp.]|uniref:hypothetical protein n=1 Tax=Roseobacter sp. TaxID=1907202 RepID=UPI00329A2F3A
MNTQIIWSFGLFLALGACAETTLQNGAPIRNLPEAVVEIAGPNQDLSSVRLKEDDGCYWYLHSGPVEATLLPLRDASGRPICTRPQA